MVAGRRVTSPELIDAAVREWRGGLNLALVSALRRNGEAAVGISGADGGLVVAKKRPPVKVTDDDGTTSMVDYGLVGDIVAIDASVLHTVMITPAIPVVTPLAATTDGQVLNVNADTVAAEIAVTLEAAKLILLTRAPGILEDPDDLQSVLHWTDLEELAQLEARGALRGGMRPKVAAIRRAIQGGVPRVHVVDGRRVGALLEEVFTTDGSGTLVVEHADEAPAEPVGFPGPA
jgi:acetylglutamate kinase